MPLLSGFFHAEAHLNISHLQLPSLPTGTLLAQSSERLKEFEQEVIIGAHAELRRVVFPNAADFAYVIKSTAQSLDLAASERAIDGAVAQLGIVVKKKDKDDVPISTATAWGQQVCVALKNISFLFWLAMGKLLGVEVSPA